MTEKPKPTKPPKLVKGMEHHGEMAPVKYPDRLGKRLGNRLLSWLTPWK